MTAPADPRYIAPTSGFFTTLADIATERLGAVEGVKPKGKVEVRRAMVGQDILMLHVFVLRFANLQMLFRTIALQIQLGLRSLHFQLLTLKSGMVSRASMI